MTGSDWGNLSIAATFCSTHTRHFQEVFEKLADDTLSGVEQNGGAGAKFMVFGRYDHLFLVTANEKKDLRKVDHKLNRSKEVANQWTSYGRIIFVSDTSLSLDRLSREFPLVGACFLKINQCVFSAVDSDGDYSRHIADLVREKWGEFNDIQVIVSSTTGWEDIMVLVFGKTYSSIAKLISRIRGHRQSGVTQPLVLTSCTIPAIHLPWRKQLLLDKEARDEAIQDIFRSVDPDDTCFDWNVRFEVVPGMSGRLMESILAHAQGAGLSEENGFELNFSAVFGQVDVSVSRSPGVNTGSRSPIRELIEFLVHVGFPVAAQEPSPARAMETMIQIDLDNPGAIAAAAGAEPGEEDVVQEVEASLFDQYCKITQPVLLELGIPKPTVEVIEGLAGRLDSIHTDEFLRNEFFSLYMFGKGFVNKLDRSYLDSREKNANTAQGLREHLSDWQMYLAKCLSDRYRGRYPVGENMVVPLTSHQNSFHKFLSLADLLVSQSFSLGHASVNRRVKKRVPPDEVKDKSLAIIPIGVFLGESPSPFAITHTVKDLFTGFIDVSSEIVFDLRHLICLFHETGHILFREFEAHCFRPATIEKWKESHHYLTEIFCEAFACALCTRGDMMKYAKLSERVVDHYFPDNHSYRNGTLWKTQLIRDGASRLLSAVIGREEEPTRDEVKHRLSRMLGGFKDGGPNDVGYDEYWSDRMADLSGIHKASVRTDYSGVQEALSLISNHLQYQGEFACLLESLADCARAEQFLQYDSNAQLLKSVREFLIDGDMAKYDKASENFAILDDLWARAGVSLREAQQGC